MSIILAMRTRPTEGPAGLITRATYTDDKGKPYGASLGGHLTVTQMEDRIRYLRSRVRRDEMEGLYPT